MKRLLARFAKASAFVALLVTALALFAASPAQAAGDGFLDPEKAFVLRAEVVGPEKNTLSLKFKIGLQMSAITESCPASVVIEGLLHRFIPFLGILWFLLRWLVSCANSCTLCSRVRGC